MQSSQVEPDEAIVYTSILRIQGSLPFPAAALPQKKPLHFGLPTMPIRISQQPDVSI